MIRLVLLSATFFISFCTNVESDFFAGDKFQNIEARDSINWINSFREFRNAVFQNNRNKINEFIDFPIMNVNNEIWYLCYGGNEKLISSIPDKVKPFNETDFDMYFEKIFTKKFINAILKIKSDDLYKTDTAETKEFHDDRESSYKMYATFDEEAQTLELNLASKTKYKSEDDGASNVMYQFDILKTGQIKFRQVRLAD